MIMDHLNSWQGYFPSLKEGALFYDYLADSVQSFPEEGEYPLEENGAKALVSCYIPENKRGVWEAHRRYYDLQFLVSGRESFGWAPVKGLREITPYDPGKDVVFYQGRGDYFLLREHYFILLSPGDGHRPGLKMRGKRPVKKIVIKIPVEYFNGELRGMNKERKKI